MLVSYLIILFLVMYWTKPHAVWKLNVFLNGVDFMWFKNKVTMSIELDAYYFLTASAWVLHCYEHSMYKMYIFLQVGLEIMTNDI